MKKYKYSYSIKDISDGNGIAFAAIIPKFPNMLIMADTPKELHKIVVDAIKDDVRQRKKEGRPIPQPDKANCSLKNTQTFIIIS